MTAFGLSKNKDHITNAYPMGRIGTPEDIGGLVIFLSSRAGAHISGSFIESDGKQDLRQHFAQRQLKVVFYVIRWSFEFRQRL